MRRKYFATMAVLWPCLLLAADPSTASGGRSLSDEQWSGDLEQLAQAIAGQHPQPFHKVERAVFHAAAEALSERIPDL